MSLHTLANHMAATGRGPDSTLVHMSPREVHGLQALAMANGGTLTINPQTGLPEAGFLDSLLPALAGFALNTFAPGLGTAVGGIFGLGQAAGTGIAVGGATALASGDLGKGLMAGLGAYGGAGIGGSLASAGAPSAGMDAASAARDAGISAAAETNPAATAARLQAGANTAMSAPTDFMKSNMMNLGFAAAPALSGAFDEQTSSAPKRNYGNIPLYKRDPVTGKSYVYESIPGEEAYRAPGIVYGNADGGLIQHYDSGGITEDAVKKGVVFGNVGTAVDAQGNPLVANPNDTRSDSEKAQDYLMGKGPNPFLFYHKAPTVNPIEKAAEATKEIAKVVEEQQQRGSGAGRTSFEPGAGLAQLGGSGFTGATTDAYGDSGPTTGLASLANQGAAYLGNMGLTGASNAIAKNVDPNYGHEAALANARAMANAANESQAETARLIAQQAAAEQATREAAAAQQAAAQQAAAQQAAAEQAAAEQAAAQQAAAQQAAAQQAAAVSTPVTYSPITTSDLPSNDNYSNEGRNSGRDGGDGGGAATGGNNGDASGGGDRGTRGGFAYGGGITALANGGMYNLGSYSDGGRLLRGPGDGVSDDIPATIGEKQPARLADGEFVVPARIVSELGNGSTEAGARKLYAMMDRVQKARTKTVGKNKVAANSRADKYLPA